MGLVPWLRLSIALAMMVSLIFSGNTLADGIFCLKTRVTMATMGSTRTVKDIGDQFHVRPLADPLRLRHPSTIRKTSMNLLLAHTKHTPSQHLSIQPPLLFYFPPIKLSNNHLNNLSLSPGSVNVHISIISFLHGLI